MLGKIKKLVVLACLMLICGTSAYGMEMLYPLYSYPNWYSSSYIWDDVASANDQIDITAIINYNNGPGEPDDPNSDYPNSDYIVGLNDLVAGGVNMIGYVYTSWGTRNIEEVKADIDKWYMDYVLTPGAGTVISGIFFDEASTSPNQAILDYYEELYRYVRERDGFDTVVLNHGTNTPEAYTSRADINVLFEGDYSSWLNYETDQYVSGYSSDHFAAFVSAPSESEMMDAIDLALLRGIDNTYVTDDVLPNPWDSLPSYWDQEVAYIEAVEVVPEPATLMLLGVGLVGLLALRRKVSHKR